MHYSNQLEDSIWHYIWLHKLKRAIQSSTAD